MSLTQAASRKALDEALQPYRDEGLRIGYVPTMGALHDGHLSLIKIAKEHADIVVVSIYVNPTQFAPHEDFDAYPREIEKDLAQLAKHPAGVVYFPQTDELYPAKAFPNGPEITVDAGEHAAGLDSDFRPHFFHGVATVVKQLFSHVKPDIAVFGEKDYQQLMVIRDMVAHEGLGIGIIGGALMRDENGLALSSRNQYLSEKEYGIAVQLNQILAKVVRQEVSPDQAKDALLAAGFDKVDYITERWGRILTAGWVGKTRLLDNMAL